MHLCDAVMANCFVNASYNPALRNGTCSHLIGQFFVGFQWENGASTTSHRALDCTFRSIILTSTNPNFTINIFQIPSTI